MRLAFADIAATVEVPDSEEFLAALRAAAADWPFAKTVHAGEPVATVRASDGSYEIDIPGEAPIRTSAVSAACSTIVDVVGAYIVENPDRLCLHSGAAVFSGRLVIFPNRAHAGKSTLIARLAASGHVIFGDDILPLSDDDNEGISLGISPRLRLPMPPKASPAFRQFVSAHAAAGDDRYLYLKLPVGGLASRNSKAPLGAVVLLDRREDGPAGISHAPRSAALRSLIVQNFARAAPAGALLDRLHGLMDRLPRLVLRYSDLEGAVELLERAFSAWPPRLEGVADASEWSAAGDADADEEPEPAPPFTPDLLLVQNREVSLRSVDGELFLADAGGFSIHHLNAVGAGLWNLLAEPVSQDHATEILQTAFPDADPSVISADVARLFAALARRQFILPVSA